MCVILLLFPLYCIGQQGRNFKIVRSANRKSIVSNVVLFYIGSVPVRLQRVKDFDVEVNKINKLDVDPADEKDYSLYSCNRRMLPANDTIILQKRLYIGNPTRELNNTLNSR